MPHLVYQGRYWNLSGDEFVLPSGCAAFLRLFWICALIAIISSTMNDLEGCDDGWVILLYLFLSVVLCALAILCEVCLAVISFKGSIVDLNARSGLSKYITSHVFLGCLQFCCAILGIVIVTRHEFPCSDSLSVAVDDVLLLTVVVSQLIDVFGIFCCFSVFRSRKAQTSEYEDVKMTKQNDYSLDDAKERWKIRCKRGCKFLQLCTCNLFGGHGIGDELESVGALFAQFFHHDGFLDVVPSDVAAGLVLVRLQQRAFVYSLKTAINSPLVGADGGSSDGEADGEAMVMMRKKRVYYHVDVKRLGKRLFDKSDPKDFKLITDAAHYAPYALSAYTHLMYLFMNPMCGLCKLCSARTCGGEHLKNDSDLRGESSGAAAASQRNCFGTCCYSGPGAVVGDNCCMINKTAMLKMVQNRNGELIFANYSNNLDIKPYGVFVDHDREAVVVAIRGTLSLDDCITDALAEAVTMQHAGEKWGFDGSSIYAHSGMLRAAMWIREDLETSGLLFDLLPPQDLAATGDIETGTSVESVVRRPSPAGGVSGTFRTNATLHTPLNRKVYRQLVVTGHSLGAGTAAILSILLRPVYPNLQCFAYGAPGSVLDEKSSKDCHSFLTSVILGKDLVGSLSVKNLAELRTRVLDAIIRCKVNKNVVMRALFEERCHDLDSLLYPPGAEPDSDFKKMVDAFNEHMQRRSVDMQKVKLYIPGRILHLVKSKTEKKRCFGKMKEYEPTDADLKDFTEIKISPTMVMEHLPDQYCSALDNLVEKWKSSS